MRTRVGYTGGSHVNPTYRDLGDHTEALQVDFDPHVTSFKDLVALFWESHNPTLRRPNVQYRAVLFWHDETQKDEAVRSAREVQHGLERELTTELLPASRFYRAEDYHQKYVLRRHPGWLQAFGEVYADPNDFTDSTAAARLNGLLAGFGSQDRVLEQVAPLSARSPA